MLLWHDRPPPPSPPLHTLINKIKQNKRKEKRKKLITFSHPHHTTTRILTKASNKKNLIGRPQELSDRKKFFFLHVYTYTYVLGFKKKFIEKKINEVEGGLGGGGINKKNWSDWRKRMEKKRYSLIYDRPPPSNLLHTWVCVCKVQYTLSLPTI